MLNRRQRSELLSVLAHFTGMMTIMRAVDVIGNVVLNVREEVTGDCGVVHVGFGVPHDALLEVLLLHPEERLQDFTAHELMNGILELVKVKVLLFDAATRTWRHRDVVLYDEPCVRKNKGRGKRQRQNDARSRRQKAAITR